ncbi:sarcinarray family MAST domain-containing protein [Methanosarcina sp. DH2]|uniref:sarcinarray family MAST domain-containing protein n=1 Tax=Methanosarcina sp. DH2 TaxID=2605639 RepID=UPI001E36BFC5|nr:sarcinarray family MAST domain-containing protein [Methanosarcina sp. DH2]MCC4771207.1 sarcinarray family MAST domain-containing protein [Methanosarcina sp. DH2]
MRLRNIAFGIILSFIFFQSNATALSEYGKMDVYFNDQILPGEMVATPILKVGEPFNIKVNITVYQEYKVSGQISEIGSGDFEVIEGPSQMGRYSSVNLKPNESHIFEWTVKPTEGWAGGSLPINFHYSFLEKGNPEPILNSGFTVAYCTISNEYYKGEIPTSENHPVSETEPSSTSTATPAFSLITAISALVLVFFRFSRQ